MLHKKMSKTDYAVEMFLQLIGVGICITVLYPILHMVAISFSSYYPVTLNEVNLLPKGFSTEAYRQVLENEKIVRSFLVSIFLAAAQCVGGLLAVFWTAYPLACCNFPGKKLWNVIVLFPMWFGAGMIPTYLNMQKLGLVGSYWALIFGGLISSYNLLIMTNSIKGIPRELLEAARIDGAAHRHIMWQIVFPLSKAVLATIALWIVAGSWNSYMSPAIYLTDSKMYTLQQVLRSIALEAELSAFELEASGVNGPGEWATQIRYAVLVVSIIPMLIIYPFIQKFFVKGVTLGAVKG